MPRLKRIPRWISIVFLIIGGYIVALSIGLLPYSPRVHYRAIFDRPEHWQVTSIGIAFCCAGIAIGIQNLSNSRHWAISALVLILITSFFTPIYWLIFYSGIPSTPIKTVMAVLVTVTLIGIVLGNMQRLGLLSSGSKTDNDSYNDIDPINEAETYLRYGRIAQAMDILNSAIKHTPSRAVEFQHKINEIKKKT